MKKYVVGFLTVILAAVLTGIVYAQYTVNRDQNSARIMGYNLVIENKTDEAMLQVTIRYQEEERQMEASSVRMLASDEKRYYQIDEPGVLEYQVYLQVTGEEMVEAQLQDDFGKDEIIRYQIEKENGVLVLKKYNS